MSNQNIGLLNPRRFSTGERNQREAMKVAAKLYYAKEFRRENKLPQLSRKFRAVADAVVREPCWPS